MRKFIWLLLWCAVSALYGQSTAHDISVQLVATVNVGPDNVLLQWNGLPSATQYKVYRKLPANPAWGTAIATLAPSDTFFVDNTVMPGVLYEYRVERTAAQTAYGYLLSGVNIKQTYNRGILILVVDSFFLPSLESDVSQLIRDYEADGYIVKRLDARRDSSVGWIKSRIQALYNQDPSNTGTLMLLGHIPVPYSGLINPDGHPDHYGAWPADVYYADMDGMWTDASVDDNFSASDPRNHNVPGDGKWDQSILPSDVELQTGRVDFYNLPVFGLPESSLMQRYLQKLHAFKTAQFVPNDIAIVEDNFGAFAEGFSSSGLRSFTPTVGVENTLIADWLTSLNSSSALWSYGCGGGWYQGAGGIASSSDLASDSIQSVFNMLFGSYFGDWDNSNNFLRAALGSGTILTNAWAGRPHWHFHHMAMGYSVGQCTRITQNNTSTYITSTLAPGYFGKWIHVALMGDPSLRLHYISPPDQLIAVENAQSFIDLSWIASPELIEGYYVYRKEPGDVNWNLLNLVPLTSVTYTDSTMGSGGTFTYMVRAARMQQTSSGYYENLSLGTMAEATSTLTLNSNSSEPVFTVYPNPASEVVNISIQCCEYPAMVSIYGSDGREISSHVWPNSDNIQIPVHALPSGVYYIHFAGKVAKLVKL